MRLWRMGAKRYDRAVLRGVFLFGSEVKWSPYSNYLKKLNYGSSSPLPARPYGRTAHTGRFVRLRSGHDKAKPQSGRISALAGREGRLRACYSILSAKRLTATQTLVTTSIIKSDITPGLWPGAVALFSGGEELGGSDGHCSCS